ncbi:TIGR03086 family metal-binding protein [Nocardia sp. NPDC127579]|uniref:TIGR03086 family metal-binding protein n=1 Tax=Nocardia sp. NPDC127579 TaxID=3345402 RepID=UPI003629B649
METAPTRPVGVIGRIDRALDATGKIIEAVAHTQLTQATPCPEWDVRAVLNHTVAGMHRVAAALSGMGSGAEREDDWLGSDPQGAYAAAAEIDRAAWHRPDALTAKLDSPIGVLPGAAVAVMHLSEIVVHGLDLAIAVGRADLADDELCAQTLHLMRSQGGIDAFRRPGLFGPEVEIADDAPAHRKLLGYTGRDC